jgi:hypothetical protein
MKRLGSMGQMEGGLRRTKAGGAVGEAVALRQAPSLADGKAKASEGAPPTRSDNTGPTSLPPL